MLGETILCTRTASRWPELPNASRLGERLAQEGYHTWGSRSQEAPNESHLGEALARGD